MVFKMKGLCLHVESIGDGKYVANGSSPWEVMKRFEIPSSLVDCELRERDSILCTLAQKRRGEIKMRGLKNMNFGEVFDFQHSSSAVRSVIFELLSERYGMSVSPEESNYVLSTSNRKTIEKMIYLPQGTEKVYFSQFCLEAPEGSTLQHAAEIIAAGNPCVVENLGYRRRWLFTPSQKRALRVSFEDVELEVMRLREAIDDPTLVSERLDEIFLPF
jgi:hypothetical protein